MADTCTGPRRSPELSDEESKELESLLNHHFDDRNKLEEALDCTEEYRGGAANNYRLSILGKGTLRQALLYMGYHRWDELCHEDLEAWVEQETWNGEDTITAAASTQGWFRYIRLPADIAGPSEDQLKATAYAIIGAVYLDTNLSIKEVTSVIHQLGMLEHIPHYFFYTCW